MVRRPLLVPHLLHRPSLRVWFVSSRMVSIFLTSILKNLKPKSQGDFIKPSKSFYWAVIQFVGPLVPIVFEFRYLGPRFLMQL